MTSIAHTILRYLYRDASNYKAHGEALLSGALTAELEARLCRCLIDQEYFIPEEVGLPSLRERLYEYSGGAPTDDDHLLHELVEVRGGAVQAQSGTSAVCSIEELVSRFEAAEQGGWWKGTAELVDSLDLGLGAGEGS